MCKHLVLVVGVGRSGTSLFAGISGQLGYRIPQPEIVADDTNPKGFGEPKWVVDFHTRLMRRKRVTVFDARPKAWELTAAISELPDVKSELRAWLKGELDGPEDVVVVKDPRIGWFLPLWNDAAQNAGVAPAFVTMLRHPAQILTSAKKSYGTWQTDASRAAAWINVMLQTVRQTRGAKRAFVPYPALLENWAGELQRIGPALGIDAMTNVDRAAHPEVDAFVDPSLFRNRTGWEGLEVPQRVIDLAEHVWSLFEDPEANAAAFDAARGEYDALYGEAEAISHSTVIAARPRKNAAAAKAPTPSGAKGLVPVSVKRRVKRLLKG